MCLNLIEEDDQQCGRGESRGLLDCVAGDFLPPKFLCYIGFLSFITVIFIYHFQVE